MLVSYDCIEAELPYFRHNLRVVELLALLKLRCHIDDSLLLPLKDLLQLGWTDERDLDHNPRLAEVLAV